MTHPPTERALGGRARDAFAPALPAADERSEPTARYVRAIRDHWLLVLLVVGLSVAAAAAYALTAEKRYEAEAELLVTPLEDPSEALEGVRILRDPDTGVLIIGRSLRTPPITRRVARILRVDAS